MIVKVGFCAIGIALVSVISGGPGSYQAVYAQPAQTDAFSWMVGDWVGSSQAGVPFTINIDATGTMTYIFGGRNAPMKPAEKAGDSVKFFFINQPGHYIQLTPTGPNSGNWMYVGGNTVSRSTITRRRG